MTQLTKEEYDAKPKVICILCGTCILHSLGGSYWEDYPIRHLMDFHNLQSHNIDFAFVNPYLQFDYQDARNAMIEENFTEWF